MRYTESSFEALGLGDCLPNAAVRQQAPKGAGDSGVYPRAKQGAAARRTEGSLDPLGPLGPVRIQEKYQQKPRNFSSLQSICSPFAV